LADLRDQLATKEGIAAVRRVTRSERPELRSGGPRADGEDARQ
jgi:hypothetical protein